MENFIKKIQNLSLFSRKIILITLVVIIGLILLNFLIGNFQKRIESFQKGSFQEQLDFPSLYEDLENLPSLEMSEVNEEELKEIEKKLEEYEKETENQNGQTP